MRQTGRKKSRLAVNQLPSKCKAVFEEYFYAGKSVDVIADNMGLTVSTVRVQLRMQTDRLKQTLKHLLLSLSVEICLLQPFLFLFPEKDLSSLL